MWSWHFDERSLDHTHVSLFPDSSLFRLIYAFMQGLYYFDYYNFIVSFEIKIYKASKFVLFKVIFEFHEIPSEF